MPLRKKRGRPPDYVAGRDGKPVVGLSFNRSVGQYYASHSKPRVYFGSDFDQALAKFRAWEAGKGENALVVIRSDPRKPPCQVRLPLPATWEGPVYVADGPPGKFRKIPAAVVPTLKDVTERGVHTLVTTDAFYARCRELILKNPARFAERVGIPEIGYLQDLKPPGHSLTLRQVGELYFARRKRISAHWEHKQKAYWKEFAVIVGVKTVRELTEDMIEQYHNSVWDEYETNGRSPTYVAHRFQAVRTILRHALKKGGDQQQVRRVLDLTETFEQPSKRGPSPRPITRAEFHRLLEVSSPKWRTVLMLSLNCAFYPGEVAEVQRLHVDLDTKTLVMDRGKTGVPRIAVLWDRTVEAIREYFQAVPHHSPYLFVSGTGMPYNGNHIGRNFRRRRSDAELAESVTFESIRDGSYTAAVEGGANVDQAKMLAGHRVTGVSDYYLKRNPRMVAEACAAIEKAYFG